MKKSSTSTPRGPRRGGIQKRRSIRDRDGDVAMDTKADKAKPAAPARGRGGLLRGGPRGISRGIGRSSRAQGIQRGMHALQGAAGPLAEATMLQVDGLAASRAVTNPDGGLDALVGFLERKASGLDSASNRKIHITKSNMKGDSVFITATAEDIAEIAKLDGFTFAGAVLTIQRRGTASSSGPGRETRKEPSKETEAVKDKLKGVLASRYDANLKLLNLSGLGDDPVLGEMGTGTVDTSKIFPALMAICDGLFNHWKKKRDAIVSVTLSNNGLNDTKLVNSLSTTLPDIKNLDLSGNNFSSLKSLESWRTKFKHLETLVLVGNPIESEPNYHLEVTNWYPKLLLLNGIPVRTAEQVNTLSAVTNSPIPISGGDFRDVGQVGENFIKEYINLYDNDRPSMLAKFYDSESVFSLAINMSAPRNREHSTPIPPWQAYTKQSRNLSRIEHLPARLNRNHQGVEKIAAAWSEFPATRHPDLITDINKYMIECRPQPGLADPTGQSPRGVDGLLVSIHGEFEERNPSMTDQPALRSFSRTFVLGPGVGGQPIRVISDMMTLRAHSPVVGAPQAQLQPPTLVDAEQEQEAKARQLMERTRMTMEYAVLCLQQTNWDLNAAFVTFEQNKEKLPKEAFQG